MVNYICQRCNYKTTLKSNFRRHILRKKICKPILADVSILYIKNIYNMVVSTENKRDNLNDSQKTHKDSQKTHKDSQKTHKDSQIIPKKSEITSINLLNISCNYCNKIFTRTNNRNRHIKKYCKIKKQKYIIEEKNKKISNLENKIKNITNNNTISNSNINSNNIIINNFFDTENDKIFDRLNNKKIIKYLNNKSYSNLLSLLCKQIYFNDKFPEDKNIKCTNLQSKLCDVFVDDSFKKMQKKKAYEHLTDKMAFLIQDLSDENKEKINNKGHKNLNLTYQTLDNPEQHYDNINLELYNNTKNLNI